MAKKSKSLPPVSEAEAEAAVRTLLRWTGDDPRRDGLAKTPKRVLESYRDWFSGYAEDPLEYLARSFAKLTDCDDMVVLRDIEFESHCEHHMAPMVGRAHLGYLPRGKVAGISKLARVVEIYARRLQVQERLTAEIADCLQKVLQPRGVGVVIEARHHCLTSRGVHQRGVTMTTSRMLGTFRSDARSRNEFLRHLEGRGRR